MTFFYFFFLYLTLNCLQGLIQTERVSRSEIDYRMFFAGRNWMILCVFMRAVADDFMFEFSFCEKIHLPMLCKRKNQSQNHDESSDLMHKMKHCTIYHVSVVSERGLKR